MGREQGRTARWRGSAPARRWRDRARTWVAVGLVAALVAACAGVDDDVDADAAGAVGEGDDGAQSDIGEASGEPQHGGAVRVGLEAEMPGWAPWEDTWSQSGWMVARAVYDTLLERDEEGVPQPYLAESVEPDDDFTAYTLTLREGVEFHDGTPLDAEAVVANLEVHRQDGARRSADLAAVDQIVAEDELTVRIELDQPHVAFADYLTREVGIVASPASIEDGTASSEPVGTGPFVFESWQRDQQLDVVRNDDYWREDLPYLDEVSFRPIPDEDARLQSLFSGDIEAMHSLRQSIIAQARERADEFNLYEHMANNSGGAGFNQAIPPFDDRRVREAWAYSIDQEELIAVLGGTGISPPARGWFNPASPWYDEGIEELWPSQDLDRAQAALDDYVQDPERSDGKEPGDPVTFEFNTPPDPSLLETAGVYQAQVGQIGMEMEISTMDQAQLTVEAVGEPPDFIGTHQVSITRVNQESDPDYLVPLFAPGAPTNTSNFVHEEFFDLLLEARRTPDFEERRELYFEAQTILAEELVFTTTGHTATMVGTTADLFGLDDWELPDGTPGVGHPESMARWHSAWLDG
jgi:peptide/nickel transport system substrate-binding protein